MLVASCERGYGVVIVSIVLFVVVIFFLWQAAKISARMHRRAYRSTVRSSVRHSSRESRPYEGEHVSGVTTIVNVYPGHEWGYHGAPSSGPVSQDAYQSYEMGYSGPRE